MKEKIIHTVTVHKKLFIFIVSSVVLAAAIVTTVLLYMNQHKNSAAAVTYRNYTVEKGDVTVGTSESGTVTLEQVAVSFPVDVTVDKTLVKPGYAVKTGDSLAQLNQNSITDGTAATRNKLAQAKLSLEQALADQTNKLKTAKLTYQTSIQNSAFAYTQESLTKSDLQNGITSAQKTLDDAKAQLAKYQSLQSSFAADYAKLNQIKGWRDDAKAQMTSFQTQLTDYENDHKSVLDKLDSLKSATDSAYAAYAYAKAQSGDISQAESDYETARDAYNNFYNFIKDTATAKSDLESKVSLYTAEYNNYSSSYDDYNNTFSTKYGATATADALDDKVTALQSQVKDAQSALDKAQKSYSNNVNQANQKLQGSLNDGQSAESTYNLTVEQLSQAVDTQQSSYDSLKRQLDDVNSAINGKGTLTAPCDGIIMVVNVTDGGSVKANEAVITIAKTSSVSMAVSLSEDDITNVKIGQQAQITLSAYEGQTFDAAVESISTSPARSGSASVSYTVTVKMTGTNTEQVLNGMSGEVTLIQKQKKNVLYVPDQVIKFENGVSSVLVKKQDGTQQKTTVTTGFSNGRYVEILSGLQEGDTVLAESAVVK